MGKLRMLKQIEVETNECCPECGESDGVFIILAARNGVVIVLAPRYCAICGHTWEKEGTHDTNE